MASKVFTWSGKCKWAIVQTPKDKYDKDGKEYSIDFYPADDKTEQEIRANVHKQAKTYEDEDGKHYKFRTPEDEPPTIVDAEGNKLDALVGNGSDVTLKVEIDRYTHKKWGEVVSTRLRAVRVDNLIPYDENKSEEVEADIEFKF